MRYVFMFLTMSFFLCVSCKDMTPEQKQQAVADGILCGTSVTTSIMQCTLACKPDPKSKECKETCVQAFLGATGAGKVCTDSLGADFIKNPKIIEAINKGYELGVVIYEATKKPDPVPTTVTPVTPAVPTPDP